MRGHGDRDEYRGQPCAGSDGFGASFASHSADLDGAAADRPDRRLAGVGYLLQARPDDRRRVRDRQRAAARPVAAQVQGRADGHGQVGRHQPRPQEGAGHHRDHARGDAAPDRQDHLLGGQAAALRRQGLGPRYAAVRLLCRHDAVDREGQGRSAISSARRIRRSSTTSVPGTTFKLRDQADRLDQPRLADLLPRHRGRRGAGLGARATWRGT